MKTANGSSFFGLADLANDGDLDFEIDPLGDFETFLVLCTFSGFPIRPIFIPSDLIIPGCGESDLLGDLADLDLLPDLIEALFDLDWLLDGLLD